MPLGSVCSPRYRCMNSALMKKHIHTRVTHTYASNTIDKSSPVNKTFLFSSIKHFSSAIRGYRSFTPNYHNFKINNHRLAEPFRHNLCHSSYHSVYNYVIALEFLRYKNSIDSHKRKTKN